MDEAAELTFDALRLLDAVFAFLESQSLDRVGFAGCTLTMGMDSEYGFWEGLEPILDEEAPAPQRGGLLSTCRDDEFQESDESVVGELDPGLGEPGNFGDV
jgi:hypothetical protein